MSRKIERNEFLGFENIFVFKENLKNFLAKLVGQINVFNIIFM
jgi:hypothetical protein